MCFAKIEKWSQRSLQVVYMLEAHQEFWLWSKEKKMTIAWGEKKYFKKMAFKKILPPFVIPTVQNLSFCQVLRKTKKKVSYIKILPFKKSAENISKCQKWQLGLEVGGLQLKTPYHVLKLCSIRKKKSPKRCFEKVSQFVWVEKVYSPLWGSSTK